MSVIPFTEIQKKAFELGFDDVGITRAAIPPADREAYLAWLQKGYQGNLNYMENKARIDPLSFFPGARSAVIFVSYYRQPKKEFHTDYGVVAGYARGRDYHHVHRKRLKKFIAWMEQVSGKSGIAKGFSDSSPVMEKALAVQAGLGWFGKNTLLIHRKFGTFILLAGLLTTLDLEEKVLETHLPKCGSCTKCLDACPTQAFVSPYLLNATQCLSYHLIESKETIPEEIRRKNPGYVFGCDVCQDVCPHNVRKLPSARLEFAPESGMGDSLSLEQLIVLEKTPEKLHGTPLQRKKLPGLISNALSLKTSPYSNKKFDIEPRY